MSLLTREQMLHAHDIRTKTVDVPEWGGQVRVRRLTGEERDRYETSLIQEKKNGQVTRNLRNARARLVVLGVVDEEGKRIFSDADADALAQRSASAIERLFDAIRELSGMSDQAVEELAENFDETPGDALYSG